MRQNANLATNLDAQIYFRQKLKLGLNLHLMPIAENRKICSKR